MTMVHLRIVSPSARTEQVLVALAGVRQVQHVACMPEVVLEPRGDLVTALVHHDATDELVVALQRIGPWTDGMISFTDIDLTLVDPRIESDGDDDWDVEADVVVLEQIKQRAHNDAQGSWNYVLTMVAAGVIAAVGVLTDQPVLIVGAMAVSPDLSRVTAVNVGVVTGDVALAARALRTLVLGLLVASVASALVSSGSRVGELVPATFSLEGLQRVAFVTSPDVFSVIVAIAAGVAGMLAFENTKSGAAVGVAISVTTIPAAAAIGVAVTLTNTTEALGAAAQLGVNVACLVIAGSATLAGQRAVRRRRLASPG
ncbi:MAG: DUF389 domain-containing protein [Actinomycetota bacterium]